MASYLEVNSVLALLAAILLVASASNVTISTSPSGPTYPAATWVRAACKMEHPQPQVLQYRWTGSCYSTGEIVYDIAEPLLDEDSWAVIWLKSTPVKCLDHFLCTVYERSGETLVEIDSNEFQPQVSGVGVSLSDQVFLGSVPNNSAVIVDSESGSELELLCHSALQSSCSGEWSSLMLPGLQNCTEGEEASGITTSYESVRLDLGSSLDEGLYTCAIQDEVLQEQQLYIGVYNSVPVLQVESRYEVRNDSLVLKCNARGLPSTATIWSRDGVLLDNSDDQLVSSSSLHLSSQEATHYYRNTLSILDPTTSGVMQCDVYSDWMTADNRNSGRTSATAFFVVLPMSEQVVLECAFPDGTEDVHWLNVSDSATSKILTSGRNNTAVVSLEVNESTHGHTFTCTGQGSGGKAAYRQYTVIARVPDDALTVRAVPLGREPVTGQPLELKCCAATSAEALNLQPSLLWYRADDRDLSQGGRTDLHMSDEGEESCLTLSFSYLAQEDSGRYVCRGALQSVGMQDILVRETEFELTATAASSSAAIIANKENTGIHDESRDRSTLSESSKVTTHQNDISESHHVVTIITSAVFSVLMLVLLLTIGAMVLTLCVKRVRRRRNKHSSSTVEADPHTDELDSKEDKM